MLYYAQVPLGVLLHDENKLDEMGKILDHCMKLVPTLKAVQYVSQSSGSVIDVDNTQFFRILFGGDQLTVARMRGTQVCIDKFFWVTYYAIPTYEL